MPDDNPPTSTPTPAQPAIYALSRHEYYWRDHYTWLLEQGYQLRQRYHPEWVASWEKDPSRVPESMEDSVRSKRRGLMDAIRLSDESHVVLKLVERNTTDSEEYSILRYFSEEPQQEDPRNHCITLLDVLHPVDDQEHIIVVTPILRIYDDPEFETIGEGLDFLRQMLQGLAFLHEHRVVHRDIRSDNLMMEPKGIYAERFHCWRPDMKYDMSEPISHQRERTGVWPKYYIIDFGHSTAYNADQMPPSEKPKLASDNSAPEYSTPDVPCDPFPIDVYTFGNLILMDFIKGNPDRYVTTGREGYEFLQPLVVSMTSFNPSDRPTMQQALEQFDAIVSKLGTWKLRSRSIRTPDPDVLQFDRPSRFEAAASHWWRRLKYVAHRIPPMPPKTSAARKKETPPKSDT